MGQPGPSIARAFAPTRAPVRLAAIRRIRRRRELEHVPGLQPRAGEAVRPKANDLHYAEISVQERHLDGKPHAEGVNGAAVRDQERFPRSEPLESAQPAEALPPSPRDADDLPVCCGHSRSASSFALSPACLRIDASVPRASSSWSGTITVRPDSFLSLMWLPRWDVRAKPALRRARSTFAPETTGSPLLKRGVQPW